MATPKTTKADLLAAIAAEPDADAPRLALADWWDKNGQPARAEYLRLQLAQEAQPLSLYPDLQTWRNRLNELSRAHLTEWTRGEGRWDGVTLSLHRGLFEQIRFDSFLAFQREAASVFADRHVGRVSFSIVRAARKLADSPQLARARELDLQFCSGLSSDDLITLCRSPHLGNLRGLLIPLNLLTDAVLVALAQTPQLSNLRTLMLSQTYYTVNCSAASLRELLHSPYLRQLETLSLNRIRFTPAHAQALFESPNLGRLTSLNLDGCSLGPAELEQLGDAANLSSLRVLSLNQNTLGDAGTRLLAEARGLHSLQRLSLNRNLIGNAGLVAFAEAGPWSQLETLHLGSNAIGNGGFGALIECGHFPALVGIELSGNLMGDDSLWNLGRSRHFPALRVVDLAQVPARGEIIERVKQRFRNQEKPLQGPMPEPPVVTPAQRTSAPIGHADEDGLLEAIIAAPDDPIPRMIYADWLEEHGETDRASLLRCEGVPEAALVERATPVIPESYAGTVHQAVYERGLLTVRVQMRGILTKSFQASGPEWLRRCRVFRLVLCGSTRDWTKVAALSMLAQIRMLRLDPGSLREKGLAGLLSSPHLGRLFGLELPNNGLNYPDRMEALLQASTLPNLCNLNLTGNYLGVPAMRALAPWRPARPLTVLNLSHNWIGAEGVALLTQSELCRSLTQLNVSYNGLSDRGLQALLESSNLTSLTHLWISSNSISAAGLTALLQSALLRRLSYIEIGSGIFSADQLQAFLRSTELPPRIRVGLSRYYFRGEPLESIRGVLGPRLVLI